MSKKASLQPSMEEIYRSIFLGAVCWQTYVQLHNNGVFLVPQGYRIVAELRAAAIDGAMELFGFVIESDSEAIVALRGTSSPVEWVSDFIAQQTPYRPAPKLGMTHRGFTDIYMTMRKQLLAAIAAIAPDKPLFITGHSLGGALATLAAPDLVLNAKCATPAVYTFGAPRAGDPQFAKSFNHLIRTSWRISNFYDIVTQLPPLIYRSPRTDQTYYYMHVKKELPLAFRSGSVGGNHALGSYFHEVSKLAPQYAYAVCEYPPGWCPAMPDYAKDSDSGSLANG